MADGTKIEWTDATWNPVRGCSRVSEGCRNCYAERVAARFSGPGMAYEGFAKNTDAGPRWTGKVRLIGGVLDQPRRWTRPRRIFVNSMSDLFHESLDFADIDEVFDAMASAPQHAFQVLTKRPERMLAYMRGDTRTRPVLPNVWLGVSVEHQAAADERIPLLLETPAAIRFLSIEPLIGPVDLRAGLRLALQPGSAWRECLCAEIDPSDRPCMVCEARQGVDWVIVGGESGPGSRPMSRQWARDLRDQCESSGTPFLFKQWGDWNAEGERVGKKVAGRELDGRTWDAFPEARQ